MPEVRLTLHRFDSLEQATKVADDIREAGSVNYIDASSGDVVNLTIGDVTVER